MRGFTTKKRIKKLIIYTILGIYLLNIFSQFTMYTGNTVYAARNNVRENQINHTNLITIFVDNNIYSSINDEVQRYATQYIQGGTGNKYNAISNSKALIFPIDTETFSAKNIVQLLENIYFNGIEGESSNLIGAIFIGDIPLPVVNQNGYIYPTIYPYVDFEEQKFIRDEESQYFVYNENAKGQAEIWHGIINFGNNINEYKEYFQKINTYQNNPSNFVEKAIWYDDFIGNNDHFNDTSINFYQNNFIFSEDIGYHRYSNFMLKVLQGERNNEIAEIMDELNELYEENGEGLDLSSALESLSAASDNMAVPTAQIKAMIDNGYLASYSDLFGQKYLKDINNNVQTANRWIESRQGTSGTNYGDALDTHYRQIELLDEIALRKNGGVEPFLIMVNNALEDIVDEKVETEHYWMEEVLPLTYLKYKGVKRQQLFKNNCYWDEYEAYENYYFGEKAESIQNTEETSTYRGTFRNLQNIQELGNTTIQNIQNDVVPSTDINSIDLNKKSIGGSYDIFAQQVDANRGYNYNNSMKELNVYDTNKVSKKENRGVNCVSKFLGICRKRRRSITTSDNEAQCNTGNTEEQAGCESMEDFAIRFRGGASPLNLSGGDAGSFTRRSGYSYSGAVYPVFDIAGSKKIDTAENESTSFLGINKYAQLIQRKFSPDTERKKFRSLNKDKKDPDPDGKGYDEGFDYDVHFTNQIPTFDSNRISGWDTSTPKTGGFVDFFEKYYEDDVEQGIEGNIIKISKRDRGLLDDIGNFINSAPGQIVARLENQNLNPVTFSIISNFLVPVPGSEILSANIIYQSTILSNLLNPCKGEGEVYTYKTIDSRVKNDSANEDEINTKVYSIFRDSTSRVKQFYDGIISRLNDLLGDIDLMYNPSAEDGALAMFSRINNNVNTINSGLDSIVNYNITSIENIQDNPEQIANLAESRSNIFNDSRLNDISGSISLANDSLVSIKSYLDEGSGLFNDISNYISNEKEKFTLNGRDLIFYNTRREDIYNKSRVIRNKFLNKRAILADIQTQYNNLSRINNTYSDGLLQKIDQINALIQDESGYNVGCTANFERLCDSIHDVIRNYNINYAEINSGIYRINSYYKIDNEEDEEGTRIHGIISDMISTRNSLITTNFTNIIVSISSELQDIRASTNRNLTGVKEGINMTTSDRPIDSPRYLTFKGIAGDKVTFIYPDIYKAEVFSGNSASGNLELMTPDEIANSIRTYLRSVARQYNIYLTQQSNNSNNYYNRYKEAFDLLGEYSPLASPANIHNNERNYGLFDENYLITELESRIRQSPYFSGDKRIDWTNNDPILFIANIIYYQNISRPAKIVGSTIQEDIDNQKANFDMNEKISYVTNNYLKAHNDKGKYLTPNYRNSGYEVAFINSNGNDNIEYESTPDIIANMQSRANSYQAPSNHKIDEDPLTTQLLNECDIPEDGGVLLFQFSGGVIESPRRKAMKCRREKIKEKPLEIKITFPFERNESSGFWENVLNTFNPEEYEKIGKMYSTQLLFQNTNQRNQEILERADAERKELLQKILDYTSIETEHTIIRADTATGIITILTTSLPDNQNVDAYIINIGGNDIRILEGNHVISKNITVGTNNFQTGSTSFGPYTGKNLTFEVTGTIKEGLNVIGFYLCPQGEQNIQENCVMESISLNIVPGALSNITIDLSGSRMLEESSKTFIVNGTDKFGNDVGELIGQKFNASASLGTLTLNSTTDKNIKFSKFDNTKFSINAIDEQSLDQKNIEIKISGEIEGNEVEVSKTIKVIRGFLQVVNGNNILQGINISLPDKDYYSIDTNGINQLNYNDLQKIRLKLIDRYGSAIKDIDGTVTIKSKNGLLIPGKITTKNIELENGTTTQYDFSQSSYFQLSGGEVEAFFLPKFIAGEDTILISMPGVDDIEIPVSITHASPTVLQITTERNQLKNNSSTKGTVKIYDNWNNLITDNVNISLISVNNKLSLSRQGSINVTGGSLDFNIYSNDKGGRGYIYAYINPATTPLNSQKPATTSISVERLMIPTTGLNVMYLNLFGSDRGNQRGYMSSNEKYSESLIMNSDKLITVTTQLISPENIKHYSAIINDKLQITNIDGNNINLSLSDNNKIKLNVNGIGNILINKESLSLIGVSKDNYENPENLENEILTIANNNTGRNLLVYVAEQTDSIIESNETVGNAILVNNSNIFDLNDNTFDNDLIINLTNEKLGGYQVREVLYQDKTIGQLLFIINNNINVNIESTSSEYEIGNVRINGTTREYGLGFYEINSQLPSSNFGYKSIQDSYNSELGIGFTADFKNITNFGGGMSVGEATLPFGSELLINIGDPMLKRIDENESAKIYDGSGNVLEDTKFDKGLGEIIYSDPSKDIFKVINIDFNNDGLEDIIAIFKDGTIKILKNYGGTNPFQNLGALSILADRISDVNVGDVDGNGYQDLIIRTEAGGIRVYLNNLGIFDVDGYPVCLNINVNKNEISDTPENIAGTHQIFLEDMDLDGALDIVTNDNLGFIKIFYGGKTNGTVNYLSTNKYMCDTGWYDRINNTSKTVYQFGLKIDNENHILDQSLIRRQGISIQQNETQIDPDSLGIDTNLLTGIDENNITQALNNILNFDIDAAASEYQGIERLRTSPLSFIPIYESGIATSSKVEYSEIGCLTGEDPVKIYKTYENVKNGEIDSLDIDTTNNIVNGDLVRVNVYIHATKDFTGTYIDNISGPRVIPLSGKNQDRFKYFRFDSGYILSGSITEEQIENMYMNSHRDLDRGWFALDNIHMRAGNTLKFSYGIIYQNDSIIDIDVEDIAGKDFLGYTTPDIGPYSEKDNYPDITIQPEDGCNDSLFIFFNDNISDERHRTYEQIYIDLAKILDEYNHQSENNGNETQQNLINGLANNGQNALQNNDTQSISEIRNQLGGFAGIAESIDRAGMLDISEGIDFSNGINVRSEAIDAISADAIKKIEDAVGGLCNGIDLGSLGLGGGGSCGLPVPFNQAFLGVGKYHLFGCFNLDFLDNLIGNGWPAMTMPGNRGPVYGVYLPFPGIFGYPFKGAGDGFVDFVPQGAPNAYPSMFRLYLMPTLTTKVAMAMCFGPYGVGSNIADPVGSIAGNCIVFALSIPCGLSNDGNGNNATTNIPKEYTMMKGCNRQNVPCYMNSQESSSPFVLGSSSPNSNTFIPAVPDGSFAGGFINIEKTPITTTSYHEDSSSINGHTITLKGGADSQNKILGSIEQGLIQKVIKSWLDKQISYIINNLTNFKLSITFPDFNGIIGDIPSRSEITTSYKELDLEQRQKDCEDMKGFWDEDSNTCIETSESRKIKCENRGKKWTPSTETCDDKPTKNTNESILSGLDRKAQETLASKDQIANLGDSLYTNPFEQLKNLMKDTNLINIETKNITVDIPMLTSDDISAYISMSQSWLERQEKILKERQIFFGDVLGLCGWEGDINGVDDIKIAISSIKEQIAENISCKTKNAADKVNDIENLQSKLEILRNLRSNYNLNDIGDYEIYEAKSGGFYIKTEIKEGIEPLDIYLYYSPNTDDLTMFTKGYSLIKTINNGGKTSLKIEKLTNGEKYSNVGLNIKKDNNDSGCNSCIDMFADGSFEQAFGNFINLQSSASDLIRTVKENIETLEQYKQFPLQLYEWIHVTDKYLGDISNLIASTFGTLSMWMETNATRYSQYVDAIITILTTIETYQMIIDLSVDRSKSCSTCTNDNYDQFSCKLGLLCPDGLLPILEIPSTKVPSIYIDFSEINLETNITLPNFKFNTISVSLPELPNIPSPPDIDVTAKLDELGDLSATLTTDLIKNLFSQIKAVNVSIGVDNLKLFQLIPTIPSPPVLPDLPSFIPTVQMELPLLPPAPKIPKLPNKIEGAIKAAKAIGKILCIVKGKIGLVAENSIKAKAEQITQRDYEVPFRDNFDQTISSRNQTINASVPRLLGQMFSGFVGFLQSNEFKDANLKGFDISLQTYINVQFNFNYFFTLLEQTVEQINKIANMPADLRNKYLGKEGKVSEVFGEWNKQSQACIDNPISTDCLGESEWAQNLIEEYNALKEEIQRYITLIHTGFEQLNVLLAEIEDKKDNVQRLKEEISVLTGEVAELEIYMQGLTGHQVERVQGQIDEKNQEINSKEEEIRNLQNEIESKNNEYRELMGNFEQFITAYQSIQNSLGEAEDSAVNWANDELDKLSSQVSGLDFQLSTDLENKIKKDQEDNERQKTLNQHTRSQNLQDLYRDVEGTISYVDYDKETNKNNLEILKNMLSEINNETSNKEIKDKSQEYLRLITMDREIKANTNALENIENNYSSIINTYKENTQNLSNDIINDYDNFLEKAKDNSISLVSDDSYNIKLSTQLFDIDENTMELLDNQESITKKYIDYNVKNVDGYLNAIENNSAQDLNMNDTVYANTKKYLNNIKSLTDEIYKNANQNKSTNVIRDTENYSTNGDQQNTLVAQLIGGGNGGGNGGSNGGLIGGSPASSNTTIDIANYIQGYTLNTEEGAFLLSNRDYINKFQGKYLLTDINKDNKKDLILRDEHNIYIKYRDNNTTFENTTYINPSKYYEYHLTSYEELKNRSTNGFIRIDDLSVKVADTFQEVKNFKYIGENYDSISVSWKNSEDIGDNVGGYLVKMIHRADQFNDKEILLNRNRELFDKKYFLVLPMGSEIEGKDLEIDRTTTIRNIKDKIGTGDEYDIFGLNYFKEGTENINLTILDIPRNRQYSEIYALKLIGNTYKVSSSSSNQIVAGPQIIADEEGPDPTIRLYRPATNESTEGTNLEGYVGTNYILQIDREDNVAMDRIWIANTDGESIKQIDNINQKTGYIELGDLYFTGADTIFFYVGGSDINDNSYVVGVTLDILIPSIEITDVIQGRENFTIIEENEGNSMVSNPNSYFMQNIGFSINSAITNVMRTNAIRETANGSTNNNGNNTPNNNGNNNGTNNDQYVSIKATLDHDIDSGYVQFLDNRKDDIRKILTGNTNISLFPVTPGNNDVYGGYFDIGNDIGLYSENGDMIASLNPENGKITITNGFENTVQIKLDYNQNIPIIRIYQGTTPIFGIKYTSKELVSLDITSNNITVETLDNENFGQFNGGKALIKNGEVIAYISPIGQIYVSGTLFGEYGFDESTNSVIYTFKDGNNYIGSVKIRIKNLLEK